ncbi:MAG: hypothetical protein QM478_11210 [Flavobacteriaceae bacterium]
MVQISMNYRLVSILLFLITYATAHGQVDVEILEGKVTFVTSMNVYVKFNNTDKISIGDSLQVGNYGLSCLLVKNKSSSSVVCTILNGCNINTGDTVLHKSNFELEDEFQSDVEIIEAEEASVNVDEALIDENKKKKEGNYLEAIRARLSVASYSNLSSIRDNRHRIMSRFSLNAAHINNSKFSIDTYINYTNNLITGTTSSTQNSSYFNVYNLALRYDIDTTLSVTVGRKINYKASSIGAIDGIQAEKYFGKNYVGVMAGFRPDIYDYGFNSDLFQYSAYFGRETYGKNLYSQTTVGFAEQKNSGATDRRYAYFQHSSTLFKKLNLFSSMELDLYSKVNGVESTNIRLTNLYISARYRFNRKVNLSLSYDSRKRILYYETLQTDIERLLDEDIARQGIRARINVRPVKYISTGFSYSKRFQNDTDNKSDNIYGYVSHSKIPMIGGRASITYNRNSSNYLLSNIASLRYSRPFFDQRLNADFYYRFVNYDYTSNIPNFSQNYFGTHVSYYINRLLIFSLSGEFSSFDSENNFRLNARIIKRFYRQRKK